MELPHLGKHCSEPTCNQLDFLPIKCDACGRIFCNDHYNYAVHNCPNAYTKDNQVPACPLCNNPVVVAKGQSPDFAVSIHIDNYCQSDPARDRRKVFTNRCSLKGCKIKEIVPVTCGECRRNFCLKHRHFSDHRCEGKLGSMRNHAANAAASRLVTSPTASTNGFVRTVQGNMSDDEALARALALSMQDATAKTQEELDEQLARQLQASERPTAVGGARNNPRDRCNVS